MVLVSFRGELAVSRASFSSFFIFFFLVESNGNVRKLRSAAPQFTHFLLCEKIEQKVVNEAKN